MVWFRSFVSEIPCIPLFFYSFLDSHNSFVTKKEERENIELLFHHSNMNMWTFSLRMGWGRGLLSVDASRKGKGEQEKKVCTVIHN